jgi:hypothetical protein
VKNRCDVKHFHSCFETSHNILRNVVCFLLTNSFNYNWPIKVLQAMDFYISTIIIFTAFASLYLQKGHTNQNMSKYVKICTRVNYKYTSNIQICAKIDVYLIKTVQKTYYCPFIGYPKNLQNPILPQ